MPIKDSSVNIGATSISATGGVATSLEHMYDDSGKLVTSLGTGDLLAQTKVEFSRTEMQKSATSPSGYTQPRSTLVVKRPKVLLNEQITMNTVRLTLATDVETTDAEKEDLVRVVAQMLGLPDYSRFWNAGSLS